MAKALKLMYLTHLVIWDSRTEKGNKRDFSWVGCQKRKTIVAFRHIFILDLRFNYNLLSLDQYDNWQLKSQTTIDEDIQYLGDSNSLDSVTELGNIREEHGERSPLAGGDGWH